MHYPEPSKDYTETDLTIHIFSVSAALVGVCLTVIGIFVISHRLSHVRSFGEKLLAVQTPDGPDPDADEQLNRRVELTLDRLVYTGNVNAFHDPFHAGGDAGRKGH